MRFIGIDPGIATTGYAVIDSGIHNFELVDMGIITTPSHTDLAVRLNMLRQDLQELCSIFHPKVAGVEELFFASNTKTALTVAHARGVILETLHISGTEIHEFTPLQVKQAITGYGNADKKQVQAMLRMLLSLEKAPVQDDAADALAVALCIGQSWKYLQKIH